MVLTATIGTTIVLFIIIFHNICFMYLFFKQLLSRSEPYYLCYVSLFFKLASPDHFMGWKVKKNYL